MYRAVTFITAFFFLIPSARSQEATFEGLGFLEENFESLALGVSGDGAVVVGGSIVDPQAFIYEAFRWQDGEMVGLGNLPDPLHPGTTANDVSVDGSVIVGESWAFGGAREAFYWEISADSMIRVDDLPGDEYFSWAAGVSADGSIVVGGSYRLSDNFRDGFIWDVAADTTIGLGVYSATGVSADGSVVVGGVVTENCDEAFRWEDGVLELLGALPGGKLCSAGAFDVSADGSVVVGNSWGLLGPEAFRWEASADTMIGLGVPSNGQTSSANAVSADGSVIVGSYSTADGGELRASIWTEETGMRDLKEVFEDDYGLDLTGWTLIGASDISDDGHVIVGSGNNPDGNIEAWRAVLPPPVLPPENDDVADAALIFFDGDYEGTNVGATLEDGEAEVSCAALGWATDFSVWWYFIRDLPPDVTVGATISTEGSSFDTVLSLHAANSPTPLDEVACNDNAGSATADGQDVGTLWSLIEDVPITGGETYYVRVAGYSEQPPEIQQGDIQLSVNFFPIDNEATPEQIEEGLSVPTPNPVRETSTVTVAVQRGQEIAVEVFDVTGRRVQMLYDDALAGGMSETLTLDASALPAGIYVIRAAAEDFVETQRVTVVK